ncbi:DUF3054 domain-containing protein [Chloroflexia bacterium SDU3-3]|nr:DUF3054 domain-containing protein [Chloroflexia bacterium SDU3-3]
MEIEQKIAPAPSRRLALLAVGDALMFVVFAVIGILSHKDRLEPGAVASNAVPFMASWFAFAALAGVYRQQVYRSPRPLLTRTMAAWALALFPGVWLRTLLRQSEFPQISFAITTFIFNSIFLCAWHLLFTWLLRRSETNGN